MKVMEIKNENEVSKNKEMLSNIKEVDDTVEIKWNDWEILKKAIYILDEEHNWKNEVDFEKIWKVINKYDFGADKKGKVANWEKGFREGANHAFSYLLDRISINDKYDKRTIKDLDSELKDRIKIATGKIRVSSVMEE